MDDCEQFSLGSRSYQICSGQSELTLKKVNQFRALHGIGPLAVDDEPERRTDAFPSVHLSPKRNGPSGGGCCGKKKQVVQPVPVADGVGTILIKMFKEHGFEACEACYDLARRMDEWGVDGCQERIEDIVADILPRALIWEKEKAGWWAKLLPESVTAAGIRLLVERAIAAAKKVEPSPPLVAKPTPMRRVLRRPRNRPEKSDYINQHQGPFDSMFVTNGIGDAITISCYLRVRPETKTIYYATRKYEYVKEYLSLLAPPDTQHVNVWDDHGDRFAWFSLRDFRSGNKHADFPNTIDWSIFQVFPRELPFLGLPFTLDQIKDKVRDFSLPERYAVLAPFTTDKRDSKRDFTREEVKTALAACRANGLPVVLVNHGNDPMIESPGLVNLQNRTTLYESIDITMKSSMFIGTCSSMSVIATKTLPADKLLIRSFSNNLKRWKHAYYAPHKRFDFITTDLNQGLKGLKWTV